jgi:hypothetical protein
MLTTMAAWARTGAAIALLAGAAGCGAGGATGALGGGPGAACPHAQLDDIWLDKRLACLSVGENASPTVAKAPGDRVDRAFIIAQQTLANGFNNVLGSNNSRYFKYIVCVHDAPVDLTGPSSSVSFATDLVVAFGVMSVQPPEVDSSTLRVGGGGENAVVDAPCDPAVHPVILDSEGKIESLNPGALATLTISNGP